MNYDYAKSNKVWTFTLVDWIERVQTRVSYQNNILKCIIMLHLKADRTFVLFS